MKGQYGGTSNFSAKKLQIKHDSEKNCKIYRNTGTYVALVMVKQASNTQE